MSDKPPKQVGGTHYECYDIQPIEAMQAWFTTAEYRGYLRGNIIKYIGRYCNKNGIEDLRKANWYLNELIRLEEKQDKNRCD